MEYKIEGTPLPVAICQLQPGETMITERGSMSWMSPNMEMETTSGGGFGKALGRMFAGESLFLNRYTARGGPGADRAEAGLSGGPVHGEPLGPLPEEAGRRTLRRRGFHHAASVRTGHRSGGV